MSNGQSDDKQREFMSLYEPCHAKLTRYVQAVVWNETEVKDIVSETVCQAYERFDALQKKESLLYYLFTIAKRLISKYQKEKKLKEDNPALMMTKPDVNANSAYRVEVADLHYALRKIPAEQCEAVILFEILGFSLNEIADMQL